MSGMAGEFSRRTAYLTNHHADGSLTKSPLALFHIVIFCTTYLAFGFLVNVARLGTYPQWPPFMKKAVARSERSKTETGVHSCGEGTWVELDGAEGQDALSRSTRDDDGANKAGAPADGPDRDLNATTPHPLRSHPTVEYIEDVNNRDLERGPDNAGVESPARDQNKDWDTNWPPVEQMRRSGLLVAGGTMLLLIIFWPIHILWTLVWLTIYKVWAFHYINVSTRRARAVAHAHRDTDLLSGKRVVVVDNTAFIMETPIPEAERQPSQRPVDPASEDQNGPRNTTSTAASADAPAGQETAPDPFWSVMNHPTFRHTYPQPGNYSQRIKAFLEREDISPAPGFCKRRILLAEKRRRDILDAAAGVKASGPSSTSRDAAAPAPSSSSGGGENTTEQATSVEARPREPASSSGAP